METKSDKIVDEESHGNEDVLLAPDIKLQEVGIVESLLTVGDKLNENTEEATKNKIEKDEPTKRLKRKDIFPVLSEDKESDPINENENVAVPDVNSLAQSVQPLVTIGDGSSGKRGKTTEIKLDKNESPKHLKMKKPYPPFCVLHPYGYRNWNLCARVEQKLDVQHYSSRKRVKLLLVDAEGSKLEASMLDGEVDQLQDIVREGKVYSFTSVAVKNAPKQYKLVASDIECFLTKETEIEEQDDDNSIPKFSFKFITIEKLHAFQGSKHLLIDVMALVREVGSVYYKQSGDKQIPKRDVLLVDKTLQHVKMTVSGELAMLNAAWQAASSDDTIIVATAMLVNCFKAFN